MSGFSFPPPPPPPPPAATQPSPQQGHRGGFQHRGSRGRGRGNNRGGFQHSGHQQYPSNLGPRNHGFSRTDGRSQPLAHTSSVNQNGAVESVTAATFDGFQSQPSHVLYGQDTSLGYSQSVPNAQGPSFHPGFKRKHNQAFQSPHGNSPQGKPESKPKVPAPPVVPSFGFSLPTKVPPIEPAATEKEPKPNKRKQRTNNLFGLTPRGEEPENSDDDIDEEAAFAQRGQSVSIQHYGLSIQLNTAADVAAWIAERKKKFPTQAKIAASKAAQDAARQKIQEARNTEKLRRLEERAEATKTMMKGKNQKRKEKTVNIKSDNNRLLPAVKERTEADDPLARISLLEEQLKQAKEALARGSAVTSTEMTESVTANSLHIRQNITLKEDGPTISTNDLSPRLPTTTTDEGNSKVEERITRLGLAYSSDDDATGGSISDPSSEEPSSASEDPDLDSDSNSDSDPPEEESAKSRRPPPVPPPRREGPNKLEVCKQFANTGRCNNGSKCMRSHHVVCKFFAKHGHCRFGSKCRMSHDVTPNTGTGGATRGDRTKLMTLRDRMIEQELRKEAEVGVQVIKYLANHDFFKD